MICSKTRIAAAGFALAVLIGLALRVTDLSRKPMHTDEAVQAAKAGALFERNYYRYDPHEHHGPTLYYFALPVLKICGVEDYAHSSESHYRIVAALCGVGLILLLWPLAGALGRKAALFGALFMALSPGFVYYSRYFIQEVPLVLFTSGAIVCGWRWLHCEHPERRWGWVLGLGVCIGLMHATKETCVIAWAAMGAGGFGALFPVRDWHERLPPHHPLFHSGERLMAVAQIALAAASAVGVSILFYSSFFSNLKGPADSILTYAQYATRAAGGNPQDKEWNYYLHLLLWNRNSAGVWSEALIVILALAGAALAFRETLPRFFVFYTGALLIVYSLIAYKTAWCVLGMLHGMIVLAGVGAAKLLELAPSCAWKLAVSALILAGAIHLGTQSVRGAFKYAADERNPYVYVHPTGDVVGLCERVEALSRVHSADGTMLVQVVAPKSDYWPVPWYLRRLERVGYWNAPPPGLDAPVIIAAPEFAAELGATLRAKYQINAYSLRPGVLVWLYVEEGLWSEYMRKK